MIEPTSITLNFWTIDYIIKCAAFIVWSVYSFNVVIGLVGRAFYKSFRSNTKTRELEIILVSVASKKVRNSLFETINHTTKLFKGIPFYVVIDEGAELQNELVNLTVSGSVSSNNTILSFCNSGNTSGVGNTESHDYSSMRILVVPKEYRQDLLAKGRAMNYFIENHMQDDKWYSFIDDDNLILDDTFLYEIPYYEEKGFVACNPVLFNRQGRSTFTTIMDWIRYFEDITVFRFFTGLTKRPWVGLHGEMLTCKGKVFKDIGYNKGSIAEDFYFATHLVRRGHKTWQSATKVSLRPPNNIGDLCKQRARWFKGIWTDLKHCPPFMRLIVGYRLISWTCGIIGSWAFSPLWVTWTGHPAILIWISIGGLYVWIIFIYSIIKTKQPLYYAAAIPIFGIIESISFWTRYNTKKFVVIDKN